MYISTEEFDSYQSSDSRTEITIEEIWNRTQNTIKTAFESGEITLIEAPPGAGKTTSIPPIVSQTGIPVTYLASREDLYDQMAEKCEDAAVTHQTIPSPHRDCPTFKGQKGGSWQHEVTDLYEKGVSARRIHTELDLPCLPGCEYIEQWEDIDSETTDVLIGNPQHTYVETIIEDRVVVVDEFPGDAFITHFENPGDIISTFLEDTPELGYSDYTDFLQNRDSHQLTLSHTDQEVSFESCPEAVLEESQGREIDSRAGLLTYGVGSMVDLDNGFESTRKYVFSERAECYIPATPPSHGLLLDDHVLVRDRNEDEVWMLTPPDLSKANGVVGLDGTPTMEMWEAVFDGGFNRRKVLDRAEWQSYIQDALNVEILVTNRNRKPYQNPNNVTPKKDTKIAFWIWLEEGEKPGLITSKKALDVYEGFNDGEIFDYVSDCLNFGKVRSSNDFEDKTLGYVTGSRHYGDDYIKRWAALMGHSVEGQRWGDDRFYGPIGNQIRDHMRIETLQDVLRFGRKDDEETRVYVNTCVLPEWVPSRIPDEWTPLSKKVRQVTGSMIERSDKATVRDISEETDISERYTRKILNALADAGYIEKTKKPGFGTNNTNLYEWE